MNRTTVIKIGGSLFDWADFPLRLQYWLARQQCDHGLLVAGGGDAANLVRSFSSRFSLTDQDAHWLAIRAMSLQSYLLAALPLHPPLAVSSCLEECQLLWRSGARIVILDPLSVLLAEGDAGLPAGWHVTSDSIAAHLAHRVAANRLILLKSVGGDHPLSVLQAVSHGWLDEYFPHVVQSLPVQWVNLRTDQTIHLNTNGMTQESI